MKLFSALLLLAFILWVDASAANPILVDSKDLPRDRSDGVFTICALALFAESVCVALLAGRRSIQAVFIWSFVTTATFFVFIAFPLSIWPEYLPKSIAAIRVGPLLAAELAIVLVEAFVLWLMWFPRTAQASARALGVSAAGNAISFAVGLALFAIAK